MVMSRSHWHQWLRHTRHEAPTIKEQELDVARQAQMKQLAARADERWRSQESFLDAPARQQTAPAIGVKDPGGYAPQTEPTQHQGVSNVVEDPQKVKAASAGKNVDEGRFRGSTKEREDSPYARVNRGGPSENWQPQSWTPGSAQRR
ncbi:hypothetical protein AMS68_000770 [Peltaster fructicola]|uniref:Uncharacterized protein n=1 Tax=Peltaster fructicola TaxID=286661 RepID=A0A6H0XKK4_9PEZI|nr:hypothetical protein AMS68_000770 [Peltaster fructicola]